MEEDVFLVTVFQNQQYSFNKFKSMKKAGAILIISILFFGACKSKVDEKKITDNYEKGKLTVAEIEQRNPERFLVVNGRDKRNLLGQTVVKGNIINNAKMVSFKDIDIKLTFFSKTGALLEEDHDIIYETLAPGEGKSFKTKYFAPKGTDSVALKVITAKVVK
jgi:molybdopterin converting factor small subunit